MVLNTVQALDSWKNYFKSPSGGKFIETCGPMLEELAKIFDGEGAAVAHLDIREVEKDLHVHGTSLHDKKTGIQTQEPAI
jgi:hypothetical protein